MKFDEQKIETYKRITNMFGDFLAGKVVDAQKTKNFFVEIGTLLFLFSSDEVIKEYLILREYLVASKSNPQEAKAAQLYGNLILAMRKDLHYSKTVLTGKEFLKCLLKDWGSIEA